ncbi:Protein kinase [Phytophthora megakarya]|uniref:Protein kinase n=1 Tax=Phytophthora megakarya TaxID=4795 RepID=A0A225VJV3_9STRA|nr:Protein kinase [Phytophthora megakarya]
MSRFTAQTKLHDTLFGAIWMCHDADSVVVVKQIHLDLARQAFTRNFQVDNPWAERRVLDVLQLIGPHDNVVQVYQQFQQNNAWFVVMEYCDGGDLCQMLERLPQHRFPEVEALSLFTQIIRGVQWLHLNGIAHRDLSLENVLLSYNSSNNESIGTAKICDFGLSTKGDRTCCERVGKPYYMAPEVVAGTAYDPQAADVWSLGVVLFVMLTGSPLVPIAAEKEPGFIGLKEFGVGWILGAWHMNDLVSPATERLLVGMLQIDPATRFTVEEVAVHPAIHLL